MEQIDAKVLRTLLDWRVAGRRALLATVVRTWGVSPQPVASIMALGEGGVVVGSVSGGCIEDDLVFRHARACRGDHTPGGAPRLVRYGLSADEAHRFGLPCGGTLERLLEYDVAPGPLEELVRGVAAGRLMRRTVRLGDGAVSVSVTATHAALELDDSFLSMTFGPAFQPDRHSCVVALTHDPKLDDLALLEAIESEAFYVGAIGSRRNNEARGARMMAHFGHTDHSLARLRGPIGIHIGSRTPPEIAVSVMAEILAAKNGVALPPGTSVAQAKYEQDALRAGCQPVALT